MTLNRRILKKGNSPSKSPKLTNSSLRKKVLIKRLSSGVQFGAASKANLKVVVRVRPENQKEISNNARSVIDIVDDNMLIFDPNHEEENFLFQGTKQKFRDLNKKHHKEQKFMFERVFGPSSTNEEVFETTTRDIVDTILNGYNCSVFAYGATGSGKTHTMIGNENCPGIIFLTVMELYKKIEEVEETKICEVGVSYLEVYNEMVRDLLVTGKPLNLHETGQHVHVTGLTLHKPKDADDLLRILAEGNLNRSQHPTDANAESSRSHALFQVFVRQQDRSPDIKSSVAIAKLSMVDLAGSERGAVTGFRGARFREGANINKSLLALGNCINALADGKGHIPYRDSKLTRLLKDSIGGNCRSVMIATITKSSMSFEDTFNTLRYANRAKSIKTTLKKNLMNVDQHVSQYLKVVEDLKGEICTLKEQLKGYEEVGKRSPDTKGVFSNEEREMYEETIQTLRKQLEEKRSDGEKEARAERALLDNLMDLNCELKNYQGEILQLETTERELEAKIYTQRVHLVRMSVFAFASKKLEKGISKSERSIRSFQSHLEHIQRRKEFLRGKLTLSKESIVTLCEGFKRHSVTEFGDPPEFLINKLKQNELEQSIRDSHQIKEYLQNLVKGLVGDQANTEKLLVLLLIAAKHFYIKLKCVNSCDAETDEFLEKIFGMLDASRIEWADLKNTENSFGEEIVSQHATLEPQINIHKLIEFPVLHSVDLSPAVFEIAKMYRRSNIKRNANQSAEISSKIWTQSLTSCVRTTQEESSFTPVSSRKFLNLNVTPVRGIENNIDNSPGVCTLSSEENLCKSNQNLGTCRETNPLPIADVSDNLKDISFRTSLCGVTPLKEICTNHSPAVSLRRDDTFSSNALSSAKVSSSHELNSTVTIDPHPSPTLINKERSCEPLNTTVTVSHSTNHLPAVSMSCDEPRPCITTASSPLDVNGTNTLLNNRSEVCTNCTEPENKISPDQPPSNSTFSLGVPDLNGTFCISTAEMGVSSTNSEKILQVLTSSTLKNKENLPPPKPSFKRRGLSITPSRHSFSKLPPNSSRMASKGFKKSLSVPSLQNIGKSSSQVKGSSLKKSTSFLRPAFGSTSKIQENVPHKTTGFSSTAHLNPHKDGRSKRTLTFHPPIPPPLQ